MKPASRRCAVRPTLRPLVLGLAMALALPTMAAETADESPSPLDGDVLAGVEAGAHWQRLLEHRMAPRVLEALDRDPAAVRGGIPVSNCDDSGPGSLRAAVDGAVDGDIIDLTNLACSTITLTSGALTTSVDDLTLVGPGRTTLFTIDAGFKSPIIMHTGTGTLELEGLTVTGGAKYASGPFNAPGGCIGSGGDVMMIDAAAKYCVAGATGSSQARGGAISAAGSLILIDSRITGSEAIAEAGNASGGGVFAGDGLFMKYSTIHNNTVVTGSTDPLAGMGGGANVVGDAVIQRSTISGNTAPQTGGISVGGEFGTHTATFHNATVANNRGSNSQFGGGVFISIGGEFRHSTISGNVETPPEDAISKYGGGLTTAGGVTVTMDNTVVSGNFLDSGDVVDWPSDIGRKGFSPVVFSGDNSLVGEVDDTITFPAEWTIAMSPGLGGLQHNGGLTYTMMPVKGSPLINAGTSTSDSLVDQRGPGFERNIGAAIDIGAVETDTLFVDGFGT